MFNRKKKPIAPAAPATVVASPEPAALPSSGSKVPGVLDSQLRPELHEAHRVLAAGVDAWQKVIDNVEGQFLRPLQNAHDGDSPECVQVQAQIAAFRTLFV